MATPNSKATLKEYCLRSLGKPVIEINVDPDQCDDRIDEALQYFAEYHMDGVQRTYLKHQITSAEKTRGTSDDSETITDSVDSSISATWKEQKGWLPIAENIISVLQVFHISSAGHTGNMFDFQYQMRLNDLYDFTSTNLTHYQQLQEHIDMIQHLVEGEVPIRFNVHLDRLYLDMDWDDKIGDDHFIVIECYRKVNPNTYTDVYNDMYLKKYATALIKQQWGSNLLKFEGMQLPGGVVLNGRQIFDDATTDIDKLRETIRMEHEMPPDFFVG